MWKEFKAFAIKGNLMDIAVGFILGGAFAKLTSAFTGGIIAPVVGLLTSGVDLSRLETVLKPAVLDETGAVVSPAVSILWGGFLAATIDFFIVSFVLFLLIKGLNKMREPAEAPPAAAPPPPSAEVTLLTEIRDLLKR